MIYNKIGLITYDTAHLKSEQVFNGLLKKGYDLKVYSLPFIERPPRKVLIPHRPNQALGVNLQVTVKKHNFPHVSCSDDKDIDDSCGLYLILGAGILSPECVKGKKIVNAHPGIIPTSRGLDSFKWAIYENDPVGVTLHYIDENIDAGEIISVEPTPIYSTDTLDSFARRHYENEINMLINFENYIKNPKNPCQFAVKKEPKLRMPLEKEEHIKKKFSTYLSHFS